MHTRNTCFGVVAKGLSTWTWFIGSQGRCCWILGDHDVPSRSPNDPPFYKTDNTDFDDLEPVDVILFQGFKPATLHPVWSSAKTKVVLWQTSNFRSSDTRPQGWTFSRKIFSHALLGGVSNGSFIMHMGVRTRNDGPKWSSRIERFPNYLSQVWDPVNGGRKCDTPSLDHETLNTCRGLLNWSDRKFALIKGPSVFDKNFWVKRRLTDKELANVLDLPAMKFNRANRSDQALLLQSVMPGKVLVEAVATIDWGGALNDEVDEVEANSQPVARKRHALKTGDDVSEKSIKKRRIVIDTSPGAIDTSPGAGPEMTTVSAKAVKSDDAAVPEFLWDTRVLDHPDLKWVAERHSVQKVKASLTALRSFMLFYWKRKIEREFLEWFHSTEHFSDVRGDIWSAGMIAVGYAQRSSWWEWDAGSSIFFWRWPLECQTEVREGVKPMFVGAPPSSMNRQPPYQDMHTQAKVRSKVEKVISKGYITTSPPRAVRSLMYMFDVPKGTNDVRMVYDGSKSGLNAALWSPWFALPTIDAMCRSLMPEYWCADNDYGDMFLNFPLHPELQSFCGVDLSQILGDNVDGKAREIFGMWLRNAMGLRPSPYNSVKGALTARRIMLGDRFDPSNPFQWEKVVTNLPGSADYKATLPWICKVRRDGWTAAELLQYIDDMRTTARDKELAWSASSRIAKTLSWLGLQDAARKRREPSQTPGAWAGATVITDGEQVLKSVTEERWLKTQTKIRWLGAHAGIWDSLGNELIDRNVIDSERKGAPSEGHLPHAQAASIRGFLVYVSRTYTAMVPYLKGLHLSLDSWRPNRDKDGWRIFTKENAGVDELYDDKPPTWTKMVPRFRNDMKVLLDYTAGKTPPAIPVRPIESLAIYLVGDASGEGFGTSNWKQGDDEVGAEFGAWTDDYGNHSSNFREAYNLVLRVELMVENEEIKKGSELFVFTDNSTFEKAFSKGSSKSPLLHELVTRIRKLEMLGIICPHFIWIAGTRMIAQGTDGLSRGDLTAGVMAGESFLKFIPLNRTAFELSLWLKQEVDSWLPGNWIFLSPEGWFDQAFKDPRGNYVWSPAACIADVALEQVCEISQIHPATSHIFICPALMTGRWRKQLGKLADTLVTLPVGNDAWPVDCFEPLVVALICPLLARSPWEIKRSEWVAHWASDLLGVWRDAPAARRNHMRQFWLRAWGRS